MITGHKQGRTLTLDRGRALPGEEHPILVDAGKWRSALPEDAWPREFPVDGIIWRQDVFGVAERWREGRAGARELLAATLMWFHGSHPHGRGRARSSLAGDRSGARLEAALEPIRTEHPSHSDLRMSYI